MLLKSILLESTYNSPTSLKTLCLRKIFFLQLFIGNEFSVNNSCALFSVLHFVLLLNLQRTQKLSHANCLDRSRHITTAL